jgi:hypothetical protein
MFARHTPLGLSRKDWVSPLAKFPVVGKEDPYHNLLEYKGAASLVAHFFIYLCVTALVVAVAGPSLKLIPLRPTSL